MIALALLIVILFPPIKSAEAEPIIQDKDIKLYAVEKVLDEFGGGQWVYFNDLVYRESKWRNTAQNPNSSAYGLCQFLSATYKQYGEKTDDPYRQIDMCIEYIKDRYGNPHKSIVFHNKHGYY